MKKILILVAHPDDDIISFGGLIIKSKKLGRFVHVHSFTMGGPCSNVPQSVRLEEYIAALKLLNVDKITHSGDEMDGMLDTVPNCELTSFIDKLINDGKYDEVYCSAKSEHSDHLALYQAFLGSARLKSGYMPKLFATGTYQFSDQLYNENPGGKIFLPLTEEEFQLKLEAFKLHKSQQKPSPSPLGLEGLRCLAEYCGMLCGHPYGEMFYQLRYIRS
jgi:LmbE family N-acetylglucosaminyl deacetylase